jgi:hypothetical protein
LVTPVYPPTSFERYAQKPVGGLFTSTGAEGTSSAQALLTDGYGDYQLESPLVRYCLRASLTAQVFEIDGPQAWYRLCAAYPTPGDDGRLVPNWAAVARDWDAVHLSFGGLGRAFGVGGRADSVAALALRRGRAPAGPAGPTAIARAPSLAPDAALVLMDKTVVLPTNEMHRASDRSWHRVGVRTGELGRGVRQPVRGLVG